MLNLIDLFTGSFFFELYMWAKIILTQRAQGPYRTLEKMIKVTGVTQKSSSLGGGNKSFCLCKVQHLLCLINFCCFNGSGHMTCD